MTKEQRTEVQEMDLNNITNGYLGEIHHSEYDDSEHLARNDHLDDEDEDEDADDSENLDDDEDENASTGKVKSSPVSYARSVKNRISSEDLILYIRNGIEVQKCKDLLVRYNIGLVKKEAIRCKCRIPLDDRIQYGYMGLMKAIDSFDLSQGLMFSTYCTASVYQTIQRHSNMDIRLVHLPEYMSIDLARVYKYCNSVNNDKVDVETVSAETGVPVERVRNMLMYGAPKVHSYMNAGASDDKPDFTEIYAGASSDYRLDVESLDSDPMAVLEQVLSKLNDQDREFLARMHGLEGYEPHTLDEVALTPAFAGEPCSNSTMSRRYSALLERVQRIVKTEGITFTFGTEA